MAVKNIDDLKAAVFEAFTKGGETLRQRLEHIIDSTFNRVDDAGSGGGLSLGETNSTAYRGDRGKTAYDHSQTAHAPADAVDQANDYTDSAIATLSGSVTSSLAGKETSGAAAAAQTAAESYADSLITTLKDSVPVDGDTLAKLYNAIVAGFKEVTVANIAARNAYNVPSLPFQIFVTDDGDGTWALYKATTTGVGATFVKISDPDLLNAAMTASQIKTAYESNSNTNAYTDAEKAKLTGVASGATANSADAYLLARGNHSGTQLAATISDFAASALSAAPAETLITIGALINSATAKSSLVDADYVGVMDSETSNVLKKWSFANIKANIKSYLDTFYQSLNSNLTTLAGLTATTNNFIVSVGSAWASRTPTQVKTTLSLDQVDNTSDVNKPVSTLQAAADAAVLASAQTYADSLVVGLVDDRGNYNASTNLFPASGGSGTAGAVLKGDLWTVSVAGTIGGNAVTAGDLVRALVNTPGQTAGNWAVTENNIGYVAENTSNKSTSTALGTSDTLFPSQNAVKTYADTKQASSEKDASGGYVGLTLRKINFLNVLGTFTSFFTNSNTAARTYTFQDRNGTIADDTDLALKANLNSPNFTTPNIGAASGTSLAATGGITSSGGGVGYATGAGGAVVQGTSRTTTVVLSKLCGNITLFSAAQAAQAIVTFTLTNTFIAAGDFILIQHISATNAGAWQFSVVAGAGTCNISIRNVSTASITEATPLRFTIIKGVTA